MCDLGKDVMGRDDECRENVGLGDMLVGELDGEVIVFRILVRDVFELIEW